MPDLTETIGEIRYWHRSRNFSMDARKRSNSSLGGFLRTQLGWSLDMTKQEQNRIAKQAQELIKMGEAELKGKPMEVDEPAYDEWHNLICASILAREPFDNIEKTSVKEMTPLAESLPVWEIFGKDIRGFGPMSLAIIVGEAGDLSGYPKKGHLWKRMGVAVMGDVRQGGLRKGAKAEEWIKHGYSRQRRSRLWNIGDALKKGNEDGKYRTLYLQRHFVEFDKAAAEGRAVITTQAATIESWRERSLPELQKITAGDLKKNPDRYRTAGHVAKRAQRHMEKTLLRDLLFAWKAADQGEMRMAAE